MIARAIIIMILAILFVCTFVASFFGATDEPDTR